MGRIKVKKEDSEFKNELGFRNPREEFIFSQDEVPIEVLCRKWHGANGVHKAETIWRAYANEGWENQRKLFKNFLERERARMYGEKLAALDADELIEATKRHRLAGASLQRVFWSLFKTDEAGNIRFEYNGKTMKMKVSDAIRAVKEGVNIERKALGIVDEVVKVIYAEQLAGAFVQIIGKYISDPAVVRNIGRDVDKVLSNQQDQLNMIKQKG